MGPYTCAMLQTLSRTKLLGTLGSCTKSIFRKASDDKVCTEKYGIRLLVLGTGGGYRPPSVLLNSTIPLCTTNLFFNYAETTRREYDCFKSEGKVPWTRHRDVFITRNSMKNAKGLTSELTSSSVTTYLIHGPNQILETFRTAIYRRGIFGPFRTDSDINVKYLDSTSFHVSPFQVDHVIMNPSRNHIGEDKAKQQWSETAREDISVAYIVQIVHSFMEISFPKCVENGIESASDVMALKNAEINRPVLLSDGRYINVDLVCDYVIKKGQKLIVLECPSLQHLDELLLSEKIQSCFTIEQINEETDSEFTELVVHMTQMEIVIDEKYQSFIKRFGSKTRHILLHDETNPCFNSAILKKYAPLNLLSEELYPELLPGISESSWYKNSNLKSQIVHGEPGMIYTIQPDTSEKIITEDADFSKMKEDKWNKTEKLHAVLPSIKAKFRKYNDESFFPEIVFLGTSGEPQVSRSQSGILVNISDTSSLLLDCGDGLVSQLYQFYGSQFHNMLTKIKAVFLSHKHLDHHMGFLTLLDERKKAFEKCGKGYKKLWALIPRPIKSLGFLEPDQAWFSTEDLYRCVFLHTLERRDGNSALKLFLSKTGLAKFIPVSVLHTDESFGVILQFKNGKTIVYSGDTAKSPELIKRGRCCDLLIHECTYNDFEIERAREHMHCAYSDALEISKEMKSKFTLMTHFNRRNSIIFPEYHGNVYRTADFMKVTLEDLPKLQYIQDGLGLLSEDDISEYNQAVTIKKWRKGDVFSGDLI